MKYVNICKKNENDYVICKICGKKSKRLYGAHLKSHNLTSEEYLNLFPDSKLSSDSDIKNTSKNSGKHMKLEKYKKLSSDKFKYNNPNHKNNTTIEERKKRTPFCVDFWINKYPDKNINELKILLKEFISNTNKNKNYNTRIDYWLNLYDEETSKLKLKNRQSTFSLNKCIEIHGIEKGIEIFNNRQEKWLISLNNNNKLKCGYSNISQELFNSIIKTIKNKNHLDNIYFAAKNKEYYLKNNISYFRYDFVDLKNMKIIEFNGDLYHANPNIYNENQKPHPFNKSITAKDIWLKDEEKIKLANENNFDVLIVWESNYKSNKIEVLNKCLNFLYN